MELLTRGQWPPLPGEAVVDLVAGTGGVRSPGATCSGCIHWPPDASPRGLMQALSWALAELRWDPSGKTFNEQSSRAIAGCDQSCQENKAGVLGRGVAGAGINFGQWWVKVSLRR